ncbi:merozoite surface protein CMZ-8-like [Hippoglossus hippoglossus]|uniref:merozoite surface protein CMZ-8-like n=1 Tax=Hippoglossus hippoglossus TaxID=8267 RepID=UPI00148C87AE|nr:merozoite surface protein CMZ-8-like [Hippoglossus hippoglossus]
MQLNHVIVTLCLLGAVALCRGQEPTKVPTLTSVAPSNGPSSPDPATQTEASGTKVPDATATEPDATATGPVPGTPVTDPAAPVTDPAAPVTDPAAPVTDPTAPVTDPTTPVKDPTTPKPVEEVDPGLSGGAIAGITIGSIAGVAAVGGGIFGALKFTGRI